MKEEGFEENPGATCMYELSAQGVVCDEKNQQRPCPPGTHSLDAKIEKSTKHTQMKQRSRCQFRIQQGTNKRAELTR